MASVRSIDSDILHCWLTIWANCYSLLAGKSKFLCNSFANFADVQGCLASLILGSPLLSKNSRVNPSSSKANRYSGLTKPTYMARTDYDFQCTNHHLHAVDRCWRRAKPARLLLWGDHYTHSTTVIQEVVDRHPGMCRPHVGTANVRKKIRSGVGGFTGSP
jgi:hypothetical protein